MAVALSAAVARRPCQCILLLASLFALYTCPHSKVEESFNLQASHDLFYHGLGPAWTSFIGADDGACADAGGGGGVGSCSALGEGLPYDHVKFPGVVPRTFTGAFVLSTIARIISWAVPRRLYDLPSHPMVVQFLIRFELLVLSWLAHVRLSNSLEGYFARQLQPSASKKNGKLQSTLPTVIANFYLLITASQFHIPFYSSRLLPNTFALLLVIHAYAEWLNDYTRRAAMYLVFTTAIFRCDILLLLFTVGLTMLLCRQLSIVEAMMTGVLTGVVSLLVTVPLDSLLWGRPIWPEFEVWWFNAVDNRSSEWGTMAWHWYFSTALPKGMLATALLVPLAFVRLPERMDKWTRMKFENDGAAKQQQTDGMFDLSLAPLFAPVVGFVVLYSFLPHKEMRFIFPALPMFNVCAAYGMSRLHQVVYGAKTNGQKIKNKSKEGGGMKPSFAARGMHLCGLGAIACTMIGGLLFVRLSRENYPGGEALDRLRRHLDETIPLQPPSTMQQPLPPSSLGISRNVLEHKQRQWERVSLHIDVAAAMTGVSLFGQRHASRRYSSGDSVLEGPFLIEKSGYEEENRIGGGSTKYTHLLTEQPKVHGYHLIATVPGYPRLDLRNFRVETRDAIYIQEREGWQKK